MCRTFIGSALNMVGDLISPKYDGKHLHKLVGNLLGKTKLQETLTHVVIPTFDIKKMQPTVFSSYLVITYIYEYYS